jgi:hypothetical protein
MMMLQQPLPLAIWAISPWFFWAGGLLVGVPILIHLLNRRRYKIVQWAAMEYLLQALKKNRRRLKFEQLLLLATRCAILLLLGLALARPLGCASSSVASLAGGRTGLHVFVIDNSYSMAYEADRPNAPTHLDQAKILAKEQISRLASGGESVMIVSAARQYGARGAEDDSANVVLRSSYDLEAARSAVDRLAQSYGGTDLATALQLAVRLAKEEQNQPQKFLYVLTDFTRSAWETNEAEIIRRTGQDLAATFGNRIRVHDLGRPGQWNYAVLNVTPDGNLVTNKFHTDFLADVKGFGNGPESILQWKWDEQLLPDGGRIKPDLSTEVQRQTKAQVSEGGAHVLSVSLVNDEKLKVDNVRQRVIEVAAELKVLIVEGERGQELLSGSGAFLDLALAPRKEIGPTGRIRSDTYVAPEVISDLELGNRVFADYRAVILTNVAAVNPPQAEQLRKFVERGGTLMVFMGEQVNPDAYNSILLSRGLLPGKLIVRKTVAANEQGFTLDFKPRGQIHPLLSIFRGEENSGLETAQIYTYYQMEVDPAAKAEVVLKYVAGDAQTSDPAIIVHPVDRGRVVTVTTTANPDWTSFPAKPAYTALVHELLAGSVEIGDRWMNLLVGEPLVVPSVMRLSSVPVLTDDRKRQIPIEAVTESGHTIYRSRPLERPGLYQLNTGNTVLPIAVNVPADEADVRLLPPDAVRKALGDIEVQTLGDTTPGGGVARDDSTDLGWTVMLIVLGLVAFECFIAMRFGHYRRSTVKAS